MVSAKLFVLPPECVYPYGPVMPPPVPIPVPVPVPVPPPYGYGYGYGFPAYTGWICKKEAGLDPQIKDVKIEMPELNP
ncbi:hypothetical protein ANCCEY_14868 [Ancylostoma ceylanicum]|uniref:Uncharacterized protein n=1 Tax=Ancylostoma ceylanicum TaxID=53326 RepID=A0A0D6L8S7_9BILA|nr:hypothetical protein ANCCEY_14868 [Ancylostoma ceylanicum]